MIEGGRNHPTGFEKSENFLFDRKNCIPAIYISHQVLTNIITKSKEKLQHLSYS